jgi:hypothetical protein
MVVRVNGSTGIITVSGTSGAPSLRGPDGNSGISFDGDQVIISSSGLVAATFSDSAATINNLSVDTTTLEFSPGSSAAPTIAPSGDLNTGIYFPAADTIGFVEGGSEAARLNNSGRVLVASTTSRTNVANLEPRIQIEGINNDTSTVAVISNSTADGTAAQVHLCKSSNGTVGGNGAVVNNEVLGRVTFDGSDGTNFVSGADILSTCEANAATNAMTANLRFYTNNGGSGPSERMRIANAGETQIASRPNNTTLLLRYGGSPDTGRNILEVFRDAGMDSGVQNCVIRSDGNLYNTNGTYGTLSDRKLKENIVNASSQWDDVKAIQVRNFNFREDTGHETHTQIGVVAQEVELVSPRLVTESPDRDDDGNDLGTTTKYVNLSVLYMKSVKALQEAMERIETLETANASLEARLTALESA